MDSAVALLRSLHAGTRVVVRHRLAGGFTDSLGTLLAVDDGACTIRTRRGDDVVRMSAVAAAKTVPPAPQRRPRG